MKLFSYTKSLIAFLFFIPTFLLASGKLTGVVTDSLTGETLIGANIFLAGTSLGSAADIDGEFTISPIPAGTYTVKCSYVGYQSKQVDVTIADGKTLELNFKLNLDVISGGEVQVTAQALGQAAAINQQLTSNNIVNVISEQKIKELPDANAAEALGRLPGVSVVRSGGEANKIVLRGLNQNMTTITVDGVKLSPTDADSRGVDLSTISQGSLSGIVLSKAITADMEGEAIAGNVNFVTKTAPEERELQVDVFGTYSALDETAEQYNFLGRYGERFLNNKLGVQVFGNMERKNRSNEQYNLYYDQTLNNYTQYKITSFVLQYTPEIRERRGAKLLLDFNTPDDGVLRFNAQYSRTERELATIDRNYPTSGGVTYNYRGQDINTDIQSYSLQGENYLSDWQINWSMSYNESNSETPYDYNAHFTEPSILQNGQVIAGVKEVPESLKTTTTYEALIPYSVNNFNVAYFDRAQARTSSNLDFEKTAFIDIKRSYNLLDFTGEVKFGGKYRSKYHRRNSTARQAMYYNGQEFYNYVKLPDGTVVDKDFEGYGYGNLQMSSADLILLPNFIDESSRDLFGKYLLYPMLGQNRMRDWYYMNINGYNPDSKIDEYVLDNSQDGTNYNLTESITSFYLMNTLNVGNFATLITGVRFESDDNKYNAYYTTQAVTEWSTFEDTTSTHTESVVLPNIHLILKPTDFLNVRLAAYKGLSRPNFNYRLPTYVYGTSNIELGDSPFIIVGNTNLKNEEAWNFEVNTQFYGNTIGLFSVSAFYKDIEHKVNRYYYVPIKDDSTRQSLGAEYPGGATPFTTAYDLIYPYNSERETRVWGFEVEHQANLRFLPGLLGNIVLSYNVSVIKSETYTPYESTTEYEETVPGLPYPVTKTKVVIGERKTRIQDSPELFGNLVVGYDISGFSARVSYFYQGEFYNGFSSDGYANTIQKSFGRVDLSFKQQLTNNFSVGLNINNINDAEEGVDLENIRTGRRLTSTRYRYGTTADLWLRAEL